MGGAFVIALALLSDPYTQRLHERPADISADSAVTAAHRVEAEMRARVRFETDPKTAAIRVVILRKDRRISIVAFRYSAASWAVERVEIPVVEAGYDRAMPLATRSDLSSADVARLESLMRARNWSAAACGGDQVVMTVRFPEGVRDFAGCPSDAAADALWILDAGGSEGAH